MASRIRREAGFFTLIGILVALALVCIFVYFVINTYFNPQIPRQEGVTAPSGSSTVNNYQSIIGSTKEKINEMNTKTLEQLKQVESINK
jgi:hypothetical protein